MEAWRAVVVGVLLVADLDEGFLEVEDVVLEPNLDLIGELLADQVLSDDDVIEVGLPVVVVIFEPVNG